MLAVTFRFTCKSCGEIHEGVPTFGADEPLLVHLMPASKRAGHVRLGSDDCVIDDERFLIRGCLEIRVEGETDPFVWGVWVDINREDFGEWKNTFRTHKRSGIGPFAAYLGNALPTYPDTFNLHVVAHLRDDGVRPLIEVLPCENPLYEEQRGGISRARLAEVYEKVIHGE